MSSNRSKHDLRKQLLAARRAVGEQVHSAEATTLSRHAAALVSEGATVCAYVPVGTEPGSLDMLDALAAAGAAVLLPVTMTIDGVAQPLSWASYRPGELAAARFGLLEPTGPVLPPETVARADLLLVPALAVDRRGVRLGRGAGYYDRSLGLGDPTATRVAVVRDDELVDELPSEPHDIAMTHALTPGFGVITLRP
ncbi:MAG: 5-formyltetrahydrofolate cyclo-ligase [Mycobacterium sp.]